MNNVKKVGIIHNNIHSNLIDILHSKRRLDWTKEWLLNRSQQVEILPELRANEVYHFNSYFRMTEKQYKFLVERLAPIITKQEPQRKKRSFSAEERLAITLKYLATGEVHTCRHYGFRATQNVIMKMVADICLHIYDQLKNEFLKFPISEEDWRNVSNGFYEKCHLPNCVGILEGRHITFRRPRKHHVRSCGFLNGNSMILMAIIDSDSNFVFVDVGTESQLNDSDVFSNSVLKQSLEMDSINLPKYDKLPFSNDSFPSYFVGSHIFPLKPYLMKPFNLNHLSDAQLYFNLKMLNVTQKADNCFEILTNTFPVLLEPFKIDAENAKNVTLGCIALYNFLRKSPSYKLELGDEDYLQRTNCLLQLNQQGQDDEQITYHRNLLKDYLIMNRNKYEK